MLEYHIPGTELESISEQNQQDTIPDIFKFWKLNYLYADLGG
jgi:hypothetical protein